MTIDSRRQALGLTFKSLALAAKLSSRTAYRLIAANRLPRSECARAALAGALKLDLAGLSALVAQKPARRGALRGVGRSGSARRVHAKTIQRAQP